MGKRSQAKPIAISRILYMAGILGFYERITTFPIELGNIIETIIAIMSSSKLIYRSKEDYIPYLAYNFSW